MRGTVSAIRRLPKPVAGLEGLAPYRTAPRGATIELFLDGNEGAGPSPRLLRQMVRLGTEAVRRYPAKQSLEMLLARRFDVAAERVLVTAGADDALDRACRAMLAPGRAFVLPVPTFEMLQRYAGLAGAATRRVPWEGGAYPTEAVLAACSERTGAIAVVSPNNPTGAVARARDLERLSAEVPQALLIVDLAYVEFADEDLTEVVLGLPNAVAVRTFSKAWGLAGLRVGYALGPVEVVNWMRAAGSPYPTSSLSVALAAACLESGEAAMREHVSRVRRERLLLQGLLERLGAAAIPSQGNFVFARFGDAGAVHAWLARAGIAVRRFAAGTGLDNALRITCPGDAGGFERVCGVLAALARVRPEVLGPGGGEAA
jgi:histidinol-phosphate aminotransferase